MNTKVRVTADAGHNVVIASGNNPLWGYIRLEQSRVVINETGFAEKKTISALIYGTQEELKSFGWTEHMELEGTIVAKDSMSPFNTKTPEKDLKIAGKTEIICSREGNPIYRKTFYSQNPDKKDEFIQHDNSAEIKLALKQLQEAEKSATAVDNLGS